MTPKDSAWLLVSILSISGLSPAFGQAIPPDLTSLCNTYYNNKYNAEKERYNSNQSSNSLGVGGYGSIFGGGGNINTSNSNQSENQSKDINNKSNISEKDCIAVVGSYFDYKTKIEMAQMNKETTLGVSRDTKEAVLGVSSDNKEVGLSATRTAKAIGLSNSRTELVVGIGSTVGNLLGGLFNSGGQKAVAERLANAEVEKAKILAQTQVEIERLRLEQARIQAGYVPNPNTYTGRSDVPDNAKREIQQIPDGIQVIKAVRQIPRPIETGAQQSVPAVNVAPIEQSNTSPMVAVSQASNPLRILGLVIAPSCSAATLLIQVTSGQIYCAFPNAVFKAGRYFFDGKTLIPN